jgi:very-short-patch-repair endonuclease
LPEPVVNADVHDEDGVWLHRPDLSWPEHRLGLDYDGGHHLAGDGRQTRRDAARREDLRSIGWRLQVITWYDLRHRPLVILRRIAQVLDLA